ncbi:sigma-70 family RNA polymerase sigma factor [Roseibium sp.]|uniref:sigma-70 family RNA polymerase sigma factor n=1 Tax=Roseibium sp. TaxID=1936156 RepID=UPI003A96BC22
MQQSDAKADLEHLLARISGGDRAAFQNLYSATSAKLFGIILRILKDRDSASEVLQETYLKIWRNADRYEAASGRPVTWMAAIARNTAIDVLRQRRERPLDVSDDGDDPLERIADERYAKVDPVHRETLRGCLGELEEALRGCVVQAYCDGYSREELAKAYDMPQATIKTWLRRGLMRLKECMDRE